MRQRNAKAHILLLLRRAGGVDDPVISLCGVDRAGRLQFRRAIQRS